MTWLDYREKLGIGFSDERKTKYFMTKIFNFLDVLCDDYQSGCISAKEYYNFCNMVGIPVKIYSSSDRYSGDRLRAVLAVLRQYEKDLPSFLAYYIALVNVTDESRDGTWKKEKYIGLLKQMLQESQIPFDIIEDDDGVFVFPKGAAELDSALVSEPLHWLTAYPKTHKAFVKALKEYSDATPDNASDVADKFRKTLETFFQEFFSCDKSLENCKGLYGGYLKSQNVPSEISGNLESLLQSYTNFMNGYAKHHDKTSLNILEYIMYQTGNIIRLLITLRQYETV